MIPNFGLLSFIQDGISGDQHERQKNVFNKTIKTNPSFGHKYNKHLHLTVAVD